MRLNSFLGLIALAEPLSVAASGSNSSVPTAHTQNGTYTGASLAGWDQDAFLGIPFAQPPIGPLRFKLPQSYNESFDGSRNATQYGYSCMQYGQKFQLSEDCLTINVVRPSGTPKGLLPVLVWIYGGGLYTGSTADPQYNLSGIVKVSQDMGQPIIAVSFNYRVGIWGFLQSFDLLTEGSSNAGLHDQRLALQWIQENIAAFGGNPEQVVVWGESAGAQSIAYQMFSYDGRDDKLFRGAILESGGVTGAQIHDLSYYNTPYENFTRSAGCWTASDKLACLRALDQDTIYKAQQSLTWNPIIDGYFLTGYPSQLMREDKFNPVPMIIGANTDESFVMNKPNTDEELFREAFRWRNYAISAPTMRKLMELYPNDPCYAPPYHITNCTVLPSRGLQGRRAAAIGSDITMISGRRKMAELYTSAGKDVFSYRFDQLAYGYNEWDGVKHFANVAFSFQNISGNIGPSPQYDTHLDLARAIGQAYVRFIYDLNPNPSDKYDKQEKLLPKWPIYDNNEPKNMVLNATENRVEDDTWRKEGIAYINSYEVARELYA
ncbi:unnamed protein product [Clonostachys rosea f. rosea IK726]|uniref:Carboxylic ester hydrolase n=2 Tax=Bionectria ochroleuca TaxID=29856 RepID=A0A0B7JJ50_BIOOC|nr:unnamed protein product [Clonostachys rosea f. rosea IK726]